MPASRELNRRRKHGEQKSTSLTLLEQGEWVEKGCLPQRPLVLDAFPRKEVAALSSLTGYSSFERYRSKAQLFFLTNGQRL